MTVGIVRPQVARFEETLPLESGRMLGPFQITYESYGRLNADRSNAILVLHPWTASAHLAGRHYQDEARTGWWDDLVGPGRALDTDRFFVICSNVIGSCLGSTGPASLNPATGKRYNLSFPVITIADMVQAQTLLLDRLGIDRVLSVVGGSMGGMQALEWLTRHPHRVASAVILAATARASAQSIALNSMARQAIFNDPAWRRGEYLVNPTRGLALARGIGHISFLSELSMRRKFERRFAADDGLYDFFGRFEVERYLSHKGNNFAETFDANSFLYLSKALDLFDLSRGGGTLEEAFQPVCAPVQLIAFSSDWLYPPEQSGEIAAALRQAGKEVSFEVIDTPAGHDAFLVELDKVAGPISRFLNRVPAAGM